MNYPEAIKDDAAFKAITCKISEESPEGQSCADDVGYEFVLEELRKLGGLYQDSIEWPSVESKTLILLENQTKDVQCFTGLFLARLRNTPVSVPLLLALLTEFISKWYSTGFPAVDNKRGQRQWKNRINQVVNRLMPLLAEYTFTTLDESVVACRERLSELGKETEWLGGSGLNALVRAIRVVEHQPITSSGAPSNHSSGQTRGHHSPVTNTVPANKGDKANELEGRDVKKMCEQLIQHQRVSDPLNPLSFRLRRYMIWQSIDMLPEADNEKRIVIPAPPADLRQEYVEQLHRGVDELLWQKLEKSLENSPYWLTGHRLSFEYAQQLEHPDLALVIEEEAHQFFQRHPTIKDIFFSDRGTPIPCMDEATVVWLSGVVEKTGLAQTNAGSSSGDGDEGAAAGGLSWIIDSPLPPDLVTDAIFALNNQQRLDRALKVFSDYFKQDIEPRSRCYARIALAEFYEKTELSALAAEQYALVAETLDENLGLSEWEPKLLDYLQRRLLLLDYRKPDKIIVES